MMTTLLLFVELLTLTSAAPQIGARGALAGVARVGPRETPAPPLDRRTSIAWRAGEKARSAAATRPTELTITIVNSMSVAVRTAHSSNSGVSSLVEPADVTEGTISPHETASMVAPQGWAGMVAVGKAEYTLNGAESLIEASLVDQGQDEGSELHMVDFDVSYVDGFTVPITCSCSTGDAGVLSGCSLDLWEGDCSGDAGRDNGRGACANPLRGDDGAGLTATKFFLPCQGAAYTYAKDWAANSNGRCESGDVTCCVGTGCAPHPRQWASVTSPDGDGGEGEDADDDDDEEEEEEEEGGGSGDEE